MTKHILKSLLAGILIGIGAYVYIALLTVDNSVVGSILFALGLMSVFILEANLYTGKIGSIILKGEVIGKLAIMLLFNFIGIALVALCALPNNAIVLKSSEVVRSKLNKTWYRALIDAILCGVLIELAVQLYKRYKNLLVIILPVVVFILSGFEHCIANLFYYIAGYESFKLIALLYFVLYILGNSIGAIILNKIIKVSLKEEQQ